jgi:hypothetical protein
MANALGRFLLFAMSRYKRKKEKKERKKNLMTGQSSWMERSH